MTDRSLKPFLFVVLMLVLAPFSAFAQAQHWVQIEAHATLRTAEEFAARYQQRLGNVAGFRIAGGWYALAIGPYATEDEAEARRAQLVAAGDIRDDAYTTDNAIYGQQFWPASGTTGAALNPPAAEAPAVPATAPAVVEEPVQEPVVAATEAPAEPAAPAEPTIADLPDEPLDVARRLEYELTRDERAGIQIALQWFGFYRSGIDAQFGPGTRRAIEDWQATLGFDATGFLTTRQRALLISNYDAAVARYGFNAFRDEGAGIEMTLPLAMVAFDRHEAPFSHFREINGSGMRVLFISQEGTQATFLGLYEILQTLEVIPLEGERERGRDSFRITGRNETTRAHVEASYRGGAIKGWALLWGPSADADADLVLSSMRESFRTIDGVLASNAGAAMSTVSRMDLLSGLEVRRPERSRTGFFVDATGTVVTVSEAVSGCDRVTIDEAYRAEVLTNDPALGVAVLRPLDPLVPLAFAQFSTAQASINSEVRLSGFSYQDTLTRPILTFGTLGDVTGLNGETDLRRLTITAQEGDVGGPVFDASGAVMGMLLPRPETPGRILPEDVNFAASSDAIAALLQQAGRSASQSRAPVPMTAEMLTRVSADLTVLVSCWN
ncbi:MAG: trypsin-like peptidase domain-containing protein [Paracoccaceae bacterium]